MNDTDRLRSKLGRLSTPGDRARLFERLGSGGDAARIAFCEFIDEILLAREVRFASAHLGELVLDVSNRRLLRIKSLPDAGSAHPAALDVLRPGDADQIGHVAASLGAFLDAAGPLVVTEGPLPGRVPTEMLGRSASALAAALGVTLYGTETAGAGQSPQPSEAPGFEQVALAVRRHGPEGAVTEISGDAAVFVSDEPAVASPLAAVFSGVLDGPGMVAVYCRPGGTKAYLVAEEDGRRTEAVIEARGIAAALAALRPTTSG